MRLSGEGADVSTVGTIFEAVTRGKGKVIRKVLKVVAKGQRRILEFDFKIIKDKSKLKVLKGNLLERVHFVFDAVGPRINR